MEEDFSAWDKNVGKEHEEPQKQVGNCKNPSAGHFLQNERKNQCGAQENLVVRHEDCGGEQDEKDDFENGTSPARIR